MDNPAVYTEIIVSDADNLVVWVHVDKTHEEDVSKDELLSLINAEIQTVCNEHISTLDDDMLKKSPRPNPTPRILLEQGNELSQVLWLRWED